MRRWSEARERDWKRFTRALGRMGRLLQRQKVEAPVGSYAPLERERHPLLEIVIGAAGVRAAIGDVAESEHDEKGVLSWASVRLTEGAATIRLNHKGTKERCQQALDAALDALRRMGRRVSYRDLIRHENQNGYVALIRCPDMSAPALDFAR